MIKYLLLSFFLLPVSLQAQNLVPNPSFELFTNCPMYTGEMGASVAWTSWDNSPDYFNACNSLDLNVPNAVFGFQYAHTGKAMVGLVTYVNPNNGSCGSNCRELIGSQLLNPLQVGQKYYISFFVNYSGFNSVQAVATNKLGLKFFVTSHDSLDPPPINNFAQLFTDSIISDTLNWHRLSGSFIADSAYKYIGIGNFFDDLHTDTMVLSKEPAIAYYYIDDVCVTTDSIYNDSWTNIQQPNKFQCDIKVFPNPTSGIVNIKSTEQIREIQVINEIGEIVFKQQNINNSFLSIRINNISSGLYFVRIKSEKETYTSIINIIN